MASTKLGHYIEPIDIRNVDDQYGEEAVVGLSTQKQIIRTKADLDGVKLTSYKVFAPKTFAYVPDTSRRGDKMSLAYNSTEDTFLVSSISIVFRVSRTDLLIPDYLFMYFNRPEFDRYARFNSWGSARETFSWDEMCDIDIELPSVPIQQKYVDVYNAILANQRSYEYGLDDLKLSIDAIIDQFKHTEKRIPVGDLLEEVDVRNTDGKYESAQGINITKQFMPSVASSNDLLKYKIVKKNQFAYSAMQTGRDECIRIALLHEDAPIIVSPAYSVLQKKTDSIMEEYIQMWFSRSESDRMGWFMSDASIRANLDLPRFYEIQIPVPNLEKQKALVNIYNAYILRRSINERLKAHIKDMCPILIRGALETATE